MRLPKLNQIQRKQQVIDRFLGLYRMPGAGMNQFEDMKNMSGEYFPTLAPRRKRGVWAGMGKADCVIARDRLWWISAGALMCNGERAVDENGEEILFPAIEGERKMVSMGAYLVVYPDKVVINAETKERIRMEAKVSSKEYVTYSPCLLGDGGVEDIQPAGRGKTPPSNPTAGSYWVDTSSHSLKQYDADKKEWIVIPTCYTKITLQSGSKLTFSEFKQYDGVEISGCPQANLNGATTIWGIDEAEHSYIVIVGLWETEDKFYTNGSVVSPYYSLYGVTVERKAPDLDFVAELNNRLWGCSSENHEIYASALGDPTNWNSFIGNADDSYAATVGTVGDFTGCVAYAGQVLFFKERCIHQVYGTKPANFQITSYDVPGVQVGSHRSLCVINEVLYYKAIDGIYAYTGSIPTKISEALGLQIYKNAVFGRWKENLVVAMTNAAGDRELLVFSPENGLWHKQDDLPAYHMAAVGDELYLFTDSEGETTAIVSFGGGLRLPGEDDISGTEEEAVAWWIETGDVEAESVDNLYITQIRLRVTVNAGSRIRILVKYDTGIEWEPLWEGVADEKNLYTLPFRPRRCMRLRLRIEGEGDFRLYTVQTILEEGSELSGGL